MSKNVVVNQIYHRKALWLGPSMPNDPLRRASFGIQPLAPPAPHPSLHIQYFYVLCYAANFSQVLKKHSSMLCDAPAVVTREDILLN